MKPEEQAVAMEVAFNNYLADQLAELRARRILLDEILPKPQRGRGDRPNIADSTSADLLDTQMPRRTVLQDRTTSSQLQGSRLRALQT